MHYFRTVLADAQLLEKGAAGASPRHTAKAYEDAMCNLAESEARDGESVGGALSRLHTDRDDRLASLAKAAHAAEMSERREATKRAAAEVEDLRRVARGEEPVTKRVRTRELAYRLMTSFAKARAREGESAEDAMGRLMGEGDPEIRELYQIYSEA